MFKEGKTIESKKPPTGAILISRTLALSALVFMGSLSKAKGQSVPSIDSLTMEEVNIGCDLNTTQYEKVRALIQEQDKWTKEYLNSEKYLERLLRECNNWKKMGYFDNKDQFENIPNFHQIVFMGGDSTVINDFAKNRKIIKKGEQTKTGEYIVERDLEDLFPHADPAEITEEDKKIANKLQKIRIENYNKYPWMIVDTLGVQNGFPVDGLYFSTDSKDSLQGMPLAGMYLVRVGISDSAYTTAAHEQSHKLNDVENLMIPFSKFLLQLRAGGDSDYLRQPTEICARIAALRYLLWKEKIYDAKAEDFTKEHFEKIQNNKELMKSYNVIQLLHTLSPEELIWFMNNVADGYEMLNGILFELNNPEVLPKVRNG